MATPAKQAKMEENGSNSTKNLENLSNFKLEKVLSEKPDRKMVCLLGKFPDDPDTPDSPAIVILEKTPFAQVLEIKAVPIFPVSSR